MEPAPDAVPHEVAHHREPARLDERLDRGAEVAEAVGEAADGADVVWVETPSNPTPDVADTAAIQRRRVPPERPASA